VRWGGVPSALPAGGGLSLTKDGLDVAWCVRVGRVEGAVVSFELVDGWRGVGRWVEARLAVHAKPGWVRPREKRTKRQLHGCLLGDRE